MTNTTHPTQKLVEIKEIKNDVVYLKNGGMRKIIMVSGINFDLKSEEEQNIILSGFQGLLNALDFPIQFQIHSRKVNIDNYLNKIKERKRTETNELLKIQIEEYVEFVKSFVESNPIITKNFFVIVPYSPNIASEQVKSGMFSFLNKNRSSKEIKNKKEESLSQAIEQLNYRVEKVISELSQIGLQASVLAGDELTELFYNLYNPELIEKKGGEVPTVPHS